jgi:type IV pilus assembly protein PilN
MIRINLLAADRPSKTKTRAAAVSAAPGALQAYVFLLLFGGGAAAACGFLWFMKSSTLRELDGQIGSAKTRLSELQAIKAKVDEYEKQKRTLDAKISLIESLQVQQAAPVHMLDEISKALPEFVWLTQLDQTGAALKMKGEANALSSVADYMTRLQQAGAPTCAEPNPDRSICYFRTVELLSSTENNNVVTFEVSAPYSNVFPKIKSGASPPAPATPPPAAPTAAASPAPPAAPGKS